MDLDVHGSSTKTKDTLKQQATNSLQWSYASQFGKQLIQLMSMIIIVKLLRPEDLGLMSLTMVVIGFVNVFRDLGTAAAIIQKREPTFHLLSSLFWTNLCISSLVLTGIWLSAPLLAAFYNEPALTDLLRWMACIFLLQAFGTIQQAILEKNLQFDRLAKIEILTTLLSATLGILSAFAGCRVWSLVYQSLTFALLNSLLLWKTTKWAPIFFWSWSDIRGVFAFSLNLTGFNLVNFFARNADYMLIGKFLGARSLGFYTLAYRIMLYPLANISSVLTRVLLPVYCQVQNDNARIKRAVLLVNQSIAIIVFPLMLGMWVVIPRFVLLFWGVEWKPAILLLRILIPIGACQSLATTTGSLYLAKGKTNLMMKWGLFSSSLIVLSFIIGLKWGVTGVATSYAIAMALLIIPSFSIPFRLIQMHLHELFKALWRITFSSFFMFIIIWGISLMLIDKWTNLGQLMLLVPMGFLIYSLMIWGFHRALILEILALIRKK